MADGNNFLRQDIVIANLRDKTLLFLGQNTILISKRTNKLLVDLKEGILD